MRYAAKLCNFFYDFRLGFVRFLREAAKAFKGNLVYSRKSGPDFDKKVIMASGAEWASNSDGTFWYLLKAQSTEKKTAMIELLMYLDMPSILGFDQHLLEDRVDINWLVSLIEFGLPLSVKYFECAAEAEKTKRTQGGSLEFKEKGENSENSGSQ